MALGWSATTGAAILVAACGGVPFVIDNHYVQFHSGDPGANGTANVVNGGKRTLVEFTALGVSSNEETWTNWEGGVPTHVTSWSAATAGTFQASGLCATDAPVLGATLTMPAGSITIAQTVAQ